MAENYNNNNRNGGYKRQSSVSLDVATFYSCVREDNKVTTLSIGVHSDDIYLNFGIFVKGSEPIKLTQRIKMDTAQMFINIVENIAKLRLNELNSVGTYSELQPFEVDTMFFNKEKTVQKSGSILFKTVDVNGTQRIAIVGKNSSGIEITVVFGNELYDGKIIESPNTKIKVDTFDTPFFRFSSVLKEITESSMLYAVANKLASLIVGNRSGGGNNYNKSSWSGRQGDSNKRVSTAENLGESGIPGLDDIENF